MWFMFASMIILDATTKTLIRNPVERHHWVKYQLAIQGSSMAEVAKTTGVQRTTLYHVFKRPYPRMEKILADALGLTPQELFPERYDANGLPNRKMGRKPKISTIKSVKNITATTSSHVQNKEVAVDDS